MSSAKFQPERSHLSAFMCCRGTTHLVVNVQRGQPARRTVKVLSNMAHTKYFSTAGSTHKYVYRWNEQKSCNVSLHGSKVLRAMLRGCWLLSWEWVEASAAAGAWLPEADFEVQVRWARLHTYQINNMMAVHCVLSPRDRGSRCAASQEGDAAGILCSLSGRS